MLRNRNRATSSGAGVFNPATQSVFFFSALVDGVKAGQLSLSGTSVTAWNEGRNNLPFVQATGTSQPTYNSTGLDGTNPTVVFDGTSDNLDYLTGINTPAEWTVVALIKANNNGAAKTIMSGGNGSLELDITSSMKVNVVRQQQVSVLMGAATLTSGQLYLISAQGGASGTKIYINGILDASNSTNPAIVTSFKFLGDRNGVQYYSGEIPCLMMAEGSSDSLRQQMEGWVVRTYGI